MPLVIRHSLFASSVTLLWLVCSLLLLVSKFCTTKLGLGCLVISFVCKLDIRLIRYSVFKVQIESNKRLEFNTNPSGSLGRNFVSSY
jgi:hypothetical protein